ncbi:hypothetical protein FZEAL_551 [Fusarium zealandicum]|uniref:Uncharacterized protein n=1 Tax=Fusarium zealandicum TaxID=1053134 RepID=A0A8H4XPM5_9HYPO|nr:hypothetical protein FZEAL_551 [Fusarium zealandicum]
MDTLSSPGSITSTPTAPTSASRVTYTTAGTPYNPSTSQPLQPPARRGRSLKWAAGIHTSGMSLLPKSVIATLPFKTGSRSSSLQQFSPLQENYDQASSPLNDPEHGCVNMSAQVPRLGSSATPSPLASLFSDTEQDKFTDGDQSEESDDDCELSMDPLMNMTVKSLHNLASYPNPNQQRAQKALLRGIKPALNSLAEAARSEEPSTPVNRSTSRQDLLQVTVDSPAVLRGPRLETVASGRLQDDAFWYHGDNKMPAFQPENLKPFDPAVGGSSSRAPGKFTSATLASGPGAPRPLTAGPPGQRQYRPSTFESTFKALHTTVPGQDASRNEDDDVLVITRQTLRQAGIDNMEPVPTSPLLKRPASMSPQPLSIAPSKLTAATRDFLAKLQAERDGDASHHGSDENFKYPAGMASSTWTWPPPPTPVSWTSASEYMQPRYTAGPRMWTERDTKVRNERNNRAWYAGADFLTATPENIASQVQRPKAKAEFGAIGDGRPSKNRDQYRPIEISDVNRMSVADHTRPLLNMAFVSVKQFVEEEWQQQNGAAAPAFQAAK